MVRDVYFMVRLTAINQGGPVRLLQTVATNPGRGSFSCVLGEPTSDRFKAQLHAFGVVPNNLPM
jgi:hypothetical protein